jgi:hypothetical protein
MNSSDGLNVVLPVVSVCLVLPTFWATAASPRPNILFIVPDDHPARPFDEMVVGDGAVNRVSHYGAATAWREWIEDACVYRSVLDAGQNEAESGK